jgi:small-conductance mechanosensitive channel
MKDVTGGVPEFQPLVRFNTFGDSNIGFTVILRAKEFVDQYLIKHEFIKRLHERYAKEGIVIPYPIRAINYEQEKAK